MSWSEIVCAILLSGMIGTIGFSVLIYIVASAVDKLRERQEFRKYYREEYIQYRIDRYIHKGF